MIALHVTDIKKFMGLLFSGTAFDNFLFVEGDISVAVDYHIDGMINKAFITEEDGEQGEFQSWAQTKPIVTQMIKGKRLPVSMKLVLKKPGQGDLTYLLNVRFDNNNLLLVTGISHTVFTLDKTGEKEWDDNMRGFLTRNGIAFEEM